MHLVSEHKIELCWMVMQAAWLKDVTKWSMKCISYVCSPSKREKINRNGQGFNKSRKQNDNYFFFTKIKRNKIKITIVNEFYLKIFLGIKRQIFSQYTNSSCFSISSSSRLISGGCHWNLKGGCPHISKAALRLY